MAGSSGYRSFPALRFGLWRPTLSLMSTLALAHEPRLVSTFIHVLPSSAHALDRLLSHPRTNPCSNCAHALHARDQCHIAAILTVDEASTPR